MWNLPYSNLLKKGCLLLTLKCISYDLSIAGSVILVDSIIGVFNVFRWTGKTVFQFLFSKRYSFNSNCYFHNSMVKISKTQAPSMVEGSRLALQILSLGTKSFGQTVLSSIHPKHFKYGTLFMATRICSKLPILFCEPIIMTGSALSTLISSLSNQLHRQTEAEMLEAVKKLGFFNHK